MQFVRPLISFVVVALASVALTAIGWAESPTHPTLKNQSPGFYRLEIGDFEVTSLLDGTVSLPLDKLLINTSASEIQTLLAKNFETLPAEVSINAFLVNTGDRLLLVDTGAGELFGAAGGHLIDSLKAAGYSPDQVDAVLLTHMHADHSGGLVIGGRPVFPRAEIFVNRADPDYWGSVEKEAAAPENQKHAFLQGRTSLAPYQAFGRVHAFTGSTQLFTGVTALPDPGHTPGHTTYMIESQGNRLLLWGDTVHAAAVQFPKPSVSVQFDVDKAEAASQRRRMFDQAALEGYWVGGAHIAFPGLGHVRATGTSYTWVPANYSLPSHTR
jgi:glyoxylase-like metal-dependent hydrolase (beta-lactamase superfamily II)